ncbi:hypothetical protein WA026_020560 [Henosepilachna vigintioctopunctata]|uniref:Uncharacterized protein n=1 Tax=Henosepilachna vigintioctopunctata TaxID=420089 RepID=A0AAW1V180_9CUCU
MKSNFQFLFEKNRLETFNTWVYSDKQQCSARKMAEAGFIFVGSRIEPDLAKCFFCNKELDGWEKDDDPWKEHLSHSSHCQFAIRNTPEDEMTVYQFLDIANAYGEKIIEDYHNNKLTLLEKAFKTAEEYFLPN